jgi:hypothetical protein
MNSINHPWAISEKHVTRYGKTWASVDFEISTKISEHAFRTDLSNTHVGHFCIHNQRIAMTMRDVMQLNSQLNTMLSEQTNKTFNQLTDIKIKSYQFTLNHTELNRVLETISDANSSIMKAYQLGLYL